ncbi:hypothetical protein [Streptosporangium roseum]|uniref:Lipoprotein n=1 Tax=Streptosporangium roseum (strain ATCC 12428 / DSM 43021 / JCM 3005 / KCTC 9067 / NCIMB 10171 / NRRL 2505 / NI 9100) TaxID=479432 RepID=D2BBK7_STRRD|nr:hypothetical protein [Streptosporangium roseum]ACZ86076.1 hypothetical protein Sros_3129 [Streptosporangium roseum DSM 43021]
MSPARATSPNRTTAVGKSVLATLSALLILCGCGAQIFPEKILEADPAAVSEVRGIGRVVTETTMELSYPGKLFVRPAIQVENYVLMDVGASDFEKARATAHDRLQQRGWVTTGSGFHMESAKWEQTSLSIESFKDYESYGSPLEPQIEKKLKDDPARTDTYVMLQLVRWD